MTSAGLVEVFPTPSETPCREGALVLPEVSILAGGSGKGGTTQTTLSGQAGNTNSSKCVCAGAGTGPLLSLPTKLGVLPWLLPSPHPSPTLEGSLPLWDRQNWNKVLSGLKMEVTSQKEPFLYLRCPFHVLQTCFNPNI